MKTAVATVLGGATTALAAIRGYNYGAQGVSQSAFEASFRTAAELEGTTDFTSARLYTMIQEGTTNSPIDAIPAAIDTNTTLLLGLWTSSPQATFDHEITALKAAIDQYGADFAKLVVGISVGSEDLYRISATGLANDPLGVGQTPETLVDYIGQVRTAIEGTSLSGVPVGHVDTWNAFVNGSNAAVISACDFLGLDEYPYYQTTDSNGIDNANTLFFEAYDKVAAVAPGKDIWVTEAGWPVSGAQSGEAIASVDNAQIFWADVACELIERDINFWWYILQDSATPSFSVSQNGQPLYDLSCHSTSRGGSPDSNSTTSAFANSTVSGTSSATGTASAGAASSGTTGGTGTGSGSGSGSSTASGSSGSVSPSVSSYANTAGKVEGGIAGFVVLAIAAALAI